MNPRGRSHRRRSGLLTGRLVLPQWAYANHGRRPAHAVVQQWPPSTFVGPTRPPLRRVWWSWAVLGSVVVLVGSITFIVTSGNAPASTLRKTKLDAPGIAPSTTTTAPRITSTTSRHHGQDTASSSNDGIAHGVPLGDYAGEGNPAGVASFAAATGTHITYATDYLDKGSGWASMDSATNIKAWSSSPYRLAIGVPILPSVGTLAQGATGAYNQYFTILGENLVAYHEADAILRLGWEFNGNWFTWSVGTSTDAANFVGFWRQIVTTMRAVPGEKFKFMWNPNGPSPTTYTPQQAYPGNAYVDYIGTDVYDNFWGTPFTPSVSWAHQLSQQWGLDWLATFAAEQNKPIAIPEWSDEYRTDGHGLGDDPLFIDNMADWFVVNDVAFANVWTYDSSSTYRNNLLDGTFPKALAEFKADFG
jgi:beta-mannanase